MPKAVFELGVLDDEAIVASFTLQPVVDSVCVQQIENICKIASFFFIFFHNELKISLSMISRHPVEALSRVSLLRDSCASFLQAGC